MQYGGIQISVFRNKYRHTTDSSIALNPLKHTGYHIHHLLPAYKTPGVLPKGGYFETINSNSLYNTPDASYTPVDNSNQ